MYNVDTIVVLGGGIAGISCIEALFHDYNPVESQFKRIILLSNSKIVKQTINYKKTGKLLEEFDVVERDINSLKVPDGLEFKFIEGLVNHVNAERRTISYFKKSVNTNEKEENYDLQELEYDILSICIGSKPRLLNYTTGCSNPQLDDKVIVIRDLYSVKRLKEKLKHCRRLVIVGNGGIGLELVSKITDCEKVWIIRDKSIGCTFFDAGAAKFLLDFTSKSPSTFETKRIDYSTECEATADGSTKFGPSLGPDWCQDLKLSGAYLSSHSLTIEYGSEVEKITNLSDTEAYPLVVHTNGKKKFPCDLVIVAIGVSPNTLRFYSGTLKLSDQDGGILVDDQMRTSLNNVYAAGDVVSCDNWTTNELWFQMRLWTQARQMGVYVGRCITAHLSGREPMIYYNFDCFTHCTSFFGFKLVLLGRYNGQGLENQKYEIIGRVNPNKDFVKLIVKDNGRIIGAVLVGDSGLEETIENLIHDQIDISSYKNNLLDDTVDIEDYFD